MSKREECIHQNELNLDDLESGGYCLLPAEYTLWAMDYYMCLK